MDHGVAQRHVSDWARGRLDPALSREVEAHVRVCAECRAAAEAASGLEAEQQRLAGRPTPHPPTDRLASYVETPDAEPLATLFEIGTHLRSCDACQGDVTLMREAAAPALHRSWLAGVRPWFARPRFLQPALAAALLLLAYPAWVGLVEYPRSRQAAREEVREAARRARSEAEARLRPAPPSSPRGGGFAALVLRGPTRSGGEVASVRLREGQELQPLLADVVPPPGTLHASLIRDPGGEVWSASGEREAFWDPTNQLTGFLVPAAALAPGEYRLELRSAAERPPFFVARFRVFAAGPPTNP